MAETSPSIPSSFPHLNPPNSDEKDQPASVAISSGIEEPESKDPETAREPKRRRMNCPAALENCQAIKSSTADSMFSFSFDTKAGSGCTPQVTPKFGSFNFADQIDSFGGRIPATASGSKVSVEIPIGGEAGGVLNSSLIDTEQQEEDAEQKEDMSGEAAGEGLLDSPSATEAEFGEDEQRAGAMLEE